MTQAVKVDLTKEINPNFYEVWNSKKPNKVLKGGRNSFKSSVIAIRLVYDMLMVIKDGGKANTVVIRKVANTIRDSVFLKIQWALGKFGVLNQFKTTVSPFKIEHLSTGSAFYFYGLDDFQKLKSNDIGNVLAVWSAQVKDAPNYLVHSSSYLDDVLGFVTPQMLEDIERIKNTDYDYYRYLYLGEAVGLGLNVYNFSLFKKVDAIPDGERLLYLLFAVDAGHQQSATACLCIGVSNKGNLYLLDTYYYSPRGKVNKKAPSDLSKDLQDFERDMLRRYPYPVRKRTIDSAEGALRNQIYKDYGTRWNPVAKKTKATMTDYVCSLLANGRLFYLDTENNRIFESEHRNYRWDERTVTSDKPEVVKEDDHTCDALQYAVMDNLRDLGLKY